MGSVECDIKTVFKLFLDCKKSVLALEALSAATQITLTAWSSDIISGLLLLVSTSGDGLLIVVF